jgi:N-acyl-D-aspartate/D-glutamate deacylase
MATYAELLTASGNDALRQKVRVACVIAAEKVRNEATSVANHAGRLVWAKTVFTNPEAESNRMLWAVLAQNAGATVSVIINASDAAVQTAVDAAVDVFAN